MTIESILVLLVIGAIAGWLAGKLMKGGGFGLVGNSVVGIIGAIIGITAGSILGTIVMATIGAAILLFVVGLIKK